MKIYKAFWQLITFSPWLYVFDVILQLFRNLFLLLPGLIVFAIFNLITDNKPVGWNLWTLGALLVGASMARVTAMLSSTAMEATCGEYGNTLIRRNVFEQLITQQGAQTLSSSPGELINRFDTDTAAITEALSYVNTVLGSAIQALVAISIMLTISQ